MLVQTDLKDLATLSRWFLTIKMHIKRKDSSNNINARLFMFAVKEFTAH